jgi:hypothetical protein
MRVGELGFERCDRRMDVDDLVDQARESRIIVVTMTDTRGAFHALTLVPTSDIARARRMPSSRSPRSVARAIGRGYR